MHDRNCVLINCLFFFPHGINTLSTVLDGSVQGKTEVCCLQDPRLTCCRNNISSSHGRRQEGKVQDRKQCSCGRIAFHAAFWQQFLTPSELIPETTLSGVMYVIVFSVFHIVDTKCKYKTQLQQKFYFKVQTKHFPVNHFCMLLRAQNIRSLLYFKRCAFRRPPNKLFFG